MIRVNLLPVREERRRADLQQFAVMLAGMLLLSVALVSFFHWSLSARIASTKDQITTTQKQIDQFGPQLEKVKQYREAKAQIEKKLEVIEKLDESRSGPVHVLDELATHSPDRLWITRIEAENMRITIHGMSLDNELVALFLTALNDSPYFKEVELEETEAREQGGFKLNRFELSARITSPEAEKREAEARASGQTANARGATPFGTARSGGTMPDFGLDQIQGQLDKLGRLPRPYRMAMLPAVVVLVAALYVYFFYMPASTMLETARDQHLQLQRKLSEVRSVAANEDAVKEEIALLEKKLAVALRQLPDQKELPVLLTDITSLGKNAGLEFKAFRPQDEVRRDFYAEVPIDIEFIGGFHDIAMFFDEISRLPRIVNIGEMDMTIARETSTGTMLNVKGSATTFRFVEPEPEAAPAETKKGHGGHGRKAHGGGH